MLLQILDLPLQALRVRDVISIQTSEILAPAHRHSLVQSRHESAVRPVCEDVNARIGKLPGHFEGSVARSVIDQQEFPVDVSLIQD